MAQAAPYKYLLAIDGSAHADRAAAYLAKRAAALMPCEVHLVNVLGLRLAGLLTPPQQSLLLQASAETAAARHTLDAAGIAYRFHGELGDPAQCIVKLIREQACDEVVAGSRGMSALESLMLGSVAYRVVHLSPVPVTIVPNADHAHGPGNENGVHRILLAVDGSAPAAMAVDYVCSLRGARVPVEIRLLNVQFPIVSSNVRRFVSQETIDKYWRAEGDGALAGAKESLRAAGLAFQGDIVVGHAGRTIAEQALQRRCTRIVMGTRGLGALANVAVGSTALQVLHHSELPVTLVK